MKRFYFLLICCFLITDQPLNSQSTPKPDVLQDDVSKTYPVPPANKSMLFYLQRTHNTNTIVYALNYNKDSTLNEDKPVVSYWIRYADGGGIAPLSAVQEKFAYGISSKLIDKEKKIFRINLVAYDKTDIYLLATKKNKTYRAYVKINGVLSEMSRVFFKTDGGTFWSPNVVYIELTGKDMKTGKTVTERFKPIS